MAPLGEAMTSSVLKNKPPRLSTEGLKRTISDISFEISKEAIEDMKNLPPVPEVENAKCECCGMTEEFTPEYVEREREKYIGKWICGLCGAAVKSEMEKNGNDIEKALNYHMSGCVRFNKFNRAYPVLVQVEAMRGLLRKSSWGLRAKSISPRDNTKYGIKNKGLARTSSCIPAITRNMNI